MYFYLMLFLDPKYKIQNFQNSSDIIFNIDLIGILIEIMNIFKFFYWVIWLVIAFMGWRAFGNKKEKLKIFSKNFAKLKWLCFLSLLLKAIFQSVFISILSSDIYEQFDKIPYYGLFLMRKYSFHSNLVFEYFNRPDVGTHQILGCTFNHFNNLQNPVIHSFLGFILYCTDGNLSEITFQTNNFQIIFEYFSPLYCISSNVFGLVILFLIFKCIRNSINNFKSREQLLQIN